MPIWTAQNLSQHDLVTLDQIWNDPWPVHPQGSLWAAIQEGREHNASTVPKLVVMHPKETYEKGLKGLK